MDITIRPAAKRDLSSIVEMLADDELGRTREDFRDPLPESYLTAFKNISEDKNQELMVVESDGSEIVGTFQLSFIPYINYCGGIRAQIESVHVKASHRGMGLGKKMFEWAIARAKQKQARILQLTSDKKRPEAIKFYKNLGFHASHEGLKMHFSY